MYATPLMEEEREMPAAAAAAAAGEAAGSSGVGRPEVKGVQLPSQFLRIIPTAVRMESSSEENEFEQASGARLAAAVDLRQRQLLAPRHINIPSVSSELQQQQLPAAVQSVYETIRTAVASLSLPHMQLLKTQLTTMAEMPAALAAIRQPLFLPHTDPALFSHSSSSRSVDWRLLNPFHTFPSDVRNQYGAALDQLILSLRIEELSCQREKLPEPLEGASRIESSSNAPSAEIVSATAIISFFPPTRQSQGTEPQPEAEQTRLLLGSAQLAPGPGSVGIKDGQVAGPAPAAAVFSASGATAMVRLQLSWMQSDEEFQDDSGIHRREEFAVIHRLLPMAPGTNGAKEAPHETLFKYHSFRVANREDELDSRRTATLAPLMQYMQQWGLSSTTESAAAAAGSSASSAQSMNSFAGVGVRKREGSWPLCMGAHISSMTASSDARVRDLLRYRLFIHRLFSLFASIAPESRTLLSIGFDRCMCESEHWCRSSSSNP